MVPSSFMISQITAAGVSPAMAARSQPASVWPARISTPPSTACSGKMWPGCTRSSALAFLATAACTVRARSAAEMPVVTPSAASIETVKAVPILVAVARHHGRQAQALAALAGERQADQAAAEARHEVDGFGRDVVGGQHQVAFVLAVFLVDQDDHAAGAHVGDDVFDRGDGDGRDGGQRTLMHWLSMGAAAVSMRST